MKINLNFLNLCLSYRALFWFNRLFLYSKLKYVFNIIHLNKPFENISLYAQFEDVKFPKSLVAPTKQGIFLLNSKKIARFHIRILRGKITFLGEIKYKNWSECPILMHRFSCTNISRKSKFALILKVTVKLAKCPWNLKLESGRETQNCPWKFLKKCPWKTWICPCQKFPKSARYRKKCPWQFWKMKVSRGAECFTGKR